VAGAAAAAAGAAAAAAGSPADFFCCAHARHTLEEWVVLFFLQTVQVTWAPVDDFCGLPPWGVSALRLPVIADAKLTCSDSFAHTYSTAASPVQASSSSMFVRSCTYCNRGVRIPSSVSPDTLSTTRHSRVWNLAT